MKAVIMAGGEGTRLRPLTCDIPKPMARLCGRPVLEYILDLLDHHGIQDAALTMRYLPTVITNHFDEQYKGLHLEFVEEDQPLGTAGCVRNAMKIENFDQEDILVISGDALTDIDLTAAYAFHKKSGAMVTIVVTRVNDPREYGLVDFDANGRVTGFVEKPGWAQAVTDFANTGIYLLSPEVQQYIPENTSFDFSKDLFPILLKNGCPIYAYETDAYWCDIGDLSTYVSCQKDLLDGKVSTFPVAQGIVFKDGQPAGNYTLIPPVYIGKGVRIGIGAQIGPFAVLDDGCHVGNNAKVRGSVLLECAYVGDRASLTGSLVCHGASVRRGASMFEGAAIGEGSILGENATISPNVKIWPDKQIDNNCLQRENLQTGRRQVSLFDDVGMTGETGVELTPELCARLGAAIGSVSRGEKVAIGCSHDKSAGVLKMALVSGILSIGCPVWDFGSCIEPQFDYFVNFSLIHLGVYVSGGLKGSIRLVSTGGLPASRSIERSIESRLSVGDFTRAGWDNMKDPTDMTGMRQLYRQELISMAPDGLSGISAEIRGSDFEPVKLLTSVLSTIGCSTDEGVRLHLGAGGRRLSIYDTVAGYIWPERVLAISCFMDLEDGNDLALPYDAPIAIDEMAHRYHRKVVRYLNCPVDGSDTDARKLAANQPWIRDGLMMSIRILNWLKKRHITLSDITQQLPNFAVATKTIACDGNPGRVIRQISGAKTREGIGEGARIQMENGILLVRPSKLGKSLVLVAEAADTEIATELCGALEQKLDTVLLGNTTDKKQPDSISDNSPDK